MKYIKRLLALPFVLGVFAVHYCWNLCKHAVNFVRFGGEMIEYYKGRDSVTIAKVYELVASRGFNIVKVSDFPETTKP